MLDEITAANLGLIASAEVRLAPGLTVITGETGTGKTLMLGALRLLRGDKASKGVIGPHDDACAVSARFVDGDDEHVVRRTVDPQRSRAYLDGVAATAGDLADALARRVAIIGQHDQLTITSTAGVRALVDRRLDTAGSAARDRYLRAWDARVALRRELEEVGGDLRAVERERDMATFQIHEIDDAAIDPDTDVDLRDRVVAMRNADALVAEFDVALSSLGEEGAGSGLDRALAALARATALDPAATPLHERATDLASQVNELARDVAAHVTDIEADPVVLAAMEERLALLGQLRRKYGDSIEDVLAFRKEAEATRDRLSAVLESAQDIDRRREAVTAELAEAGERLRTARQAAADAIAADAITHLTDLGFTDPIVAIAVEEAEPGASGADSLSVRFASNADLAPGPVSGIASGGELSRLVLALSLAAGFAEASTLAFDEIDTGIGGATALAMGEKLKALAEHRQIVCVSHLPQVAAFADRHIRVDRTGSTAVVEVLAEDDRIRELTRMLSGLSASEPGLDHARELLAHARGS